MFIYIPTLNRIDSQKTYDMLPAKLRRFATLVAPLREVEAHKARGRKVIGCPVSGIGKVRQWILNLHKTGKLVMLDDDIRFDVRRKDNKGRFLVATESDICDLFATLETNLSAYTHVGVLAREGGNRITIPYVECTRMLRVLAYNVARYHKAGVRYDRLPVMEDFDVTLQLLRKGHANLVLCDWVNGQGSSNAAGGCSTYRTMELQERGAILLAKHHREFVRVVRKRTKQAWNGQERTDVVISWKKAYESAGVRLARREGRAVS